MIKPSLENIGMKQQHDTQQGVFNSKGSRNYFSKFHRKMKSDMKQMIEAEICSCDFQE